MENRITTSPINELYNVVVGTVPTWKPAKFEAVLKTNVVDSRVKGITDTESTDESDFWWYGTQFILSHNDNFELFGENELASRPILALSTERKDILSKVTTKTKFSRKPPDWPGEPTLPLQNELEAAKQGVGSYSMGKPFILPEANIYADNSALGTLADKSNYDTTMIESTSSGSSANISRHGHFIPRVMAIDKFSSLSMLSILHHSYANGQPTNTTSMKFSCPLMVGFANLQPVDYINTTIGSTSSDNTTIQVWYDYFSVGLFARTFMNCTRLVTPNNSTLQEMTSARQETSSLSSSNWEENFSDLVFLSSILKVTDEDRQPDIIDDKLIVARIHFHRIGANPRLNKSSQLETDLTISSINNYSQVIKNGSAPSLDDDLFAADANMEDNYEGQEEASDIDDIDIDDNTETAAEEVEYYESFFRGPAFYACILIFILLLCKYFDDISHWLKRLRRRRTGYMSISQDNIVARSPS